MSKATRPVITTAREISVRFGDQVVLNGATLNIHHNDKIGLIGSNGSGKSTLLTIIAEIMGPDS